MAKATLCHVAIKKVHIAHEKVSRSSLEVSGG
jgi:hypothetical protein